MLLSDAAVHSGCSGGALLSSPHLHTPEAALHRRAAAAETPNPPLAATLLGLITSNTQHKSGVELPHISFAIPAQQLLPIVHAAQLPDSQVVAALRALDKKHVYADSVWGGNSDLPAPAAGQRLHGSTTRSKL